MFLNVIPRSEYPKGAGYVRSKFEIARSVPDTDEEEWTPIQPADNDENPQGSCGIDYGATYVGEHENQYKPEMKGLKGPVVCQDDFTMNWQSEEFWASYFASLEKRSFLTISNRAGNVYRQYAYKAAASADFGWAVGKWQGAQPPPSVVDMTDYTTGALGLPTSELTQEMLDMTAIELMQEGADEGDTNAWISQGPDGPQFPLLIGTQMSHRLLLNNSELRSDFNQSFTGWGDMNPVIKRLGASRVIKNFRHMITRFPARWISVPDGVTVNITATGSTSSSGTTTTYANATGVTVLKRIPTYVNSVASFDATKGRAGVVNGVWNDASPTVTVGSADDVAIYEEVLVLVPTALTMEVLMPVNSMPGMTLTPQNYFGEWKFVTGNDALLGDDSCAGILDPLHTRGRHFGNYRVAWQPSQPRNARQILFKRCPASVDTIVCGST